MILTLPFMKNIFRIKENNRPVRSNNANNLELKTTKTITFGTNSLSSLGPTIWNNLPYHLKYSKSISTFKQMIKNGMVVNANAMIAIKSREMLLCDFK